MSFIPNSLLILARHSDHSESVSGKVRIELFAKSFILLVYEVLARHNPYSSRKATIGSTAEARRAGM